MLSQLKFSMFYFLGKVIDLKSFVFVFQLVDTTVELANKVGAAEIISRIVDDLKDEAEQYRKMVMETIEKIMGNLGAADIDHKLEEQLIDGILYAFQEQTTEVRVANHLLPCF